MASISDKIFSLRTEFSGRPLDVSNVNQDPIKQFSIWMEEAVNAQLPDPNAFNLSTSIKGKPSSRIVLLRGLDSKGFTFFTNYNSRKGKEMAANEHVSMNFFWPELARQVRVEGKIKKTSGRVSDEYFNSRPRENQIGAWVSAQSSLVNSRAELEKKQAELEQLYKNKTIYRPPHWGGYVIIPETIEFWQGQPGRIHDRIVYYRSGRKWIIRRLAP